MYSNRKYKAEWVGDIAAIIGIIALLPIAWYVTATEKTHQLNYFWLVIKLEVVFVQGLPKQGFQLEIQMLGLFIIHRMDLIRATTSNMCE